MAFEGIEFHRFKMLRGKLIDLQYLSDFYALDDPRSNSALLKAVERFTSESLLEEDLFNRFVIEKFLQKNRLTTRTWMAARMGLQRNFLDDILSQIEALLPRSSYVVHLDLIDESLIDDCVTNLPGLRFRTFSDHESFCSRLHESLSECLNVPAERFRANSMWCATDQWLAENVDDGDYPRRFAQHFDCITCEPLSLAHATWLDFDKPMSLGPDRCSKLTYVRHRDDLRAYCAGTAEPDDLERYEQALGARKG